MHFNVVAPLALLPTLGYAFPWAAKMAEGRSPAANDVLESLNKRAATCPTHLTRQGAAPYSSYYPSMYTGAKNGKPGTGKGGALVPAAGDTAHAYTAPGPRDIRGPCPGLNALANHNFISHDGITTYTEMVDAAQNVYNWKYDLASFVATFGIIQDGNILTQVLSIGCFGGLSVPDTGLNTHNKFEADASMARTDYALSPSGDAYTVNGTLFGQLVDDCQSSDYSLDCMGKFNQRRFNQSLSTNGDFFNGPLAFFTLGTCQLPLNSFANFASGSPNPTKDTISSFWGTTQNADGTWTYNRNESIPEYWYNRPEAYAFGTIIDQIFSSYQTYPAPLGGNTGAPNTFAGLNYPGFVQDGALTNATPEGVACLLLNLVTFGLPTSLTQMLQVTAKQAGFATGKLGSLLSEFECAS